MPLIRRTTDLHLNLNKVTDESQVGFACLRYGCGAYLQICSQKRSKSFLFLSLIWDLFPMPYKDKDEISKIQFCKLIHREGTPEGGSYLDIVALYQSYVRPRFSIARVRNRNQFFSAATNHFITFNQLLVEGVQNDFLLSFHTFRKVQARGLAIPDDPAGQANP